MVRYKPSSRLRSPSKFGRSASVALKDATSILDEARNDAALAQHQGSFLVQKAFADAGRDLADLAGLLGVGSARLTRQLNGVLGADAIDVGAWKHAASRIGDVERVTQVPPVLPSAPEHIDSWTGKLWEGDCLPLMRAMPEDSVDLVLADLPYGTTRNSWDSVIDLDDLWDAYERVLRPGGAIVLTAAQPFTSTLVASRPELFKYEWIWSKTIGSGQLNINHQPLRTHESVLVFAKGVTTYNAQMTTGSPYSIKRKAGEWNGRGYNGQSEHQAENAGVRHPKTVLLVPNPRVTGGHPTQKPVELFEYMIRTYTNAGGVVLDNVVGSGTTAVAAINTGRRFVVMENDPQYVTMATKRIKEAQSARTMRSEAEGARPVVEPGNDTGVSGPAAQAVTVSPDEGFLW